MLVFVFHMFVCCICDIYLSTCVYLFAYMDIFCVQMHTYVYVHICAYMFTLVWVYMCISLYVYMRISMYVYM